MAFSFILKSTIGFLLIGLHSVYPNAVNPEIDCKPFVQFINNTPKQLKLYSNDLYVTTLKTGQLWAAKANTGIEFEFVSIQDKSEHYKFIVGKKCKQEVKLINLTKEREHLEPSKT